MDNMENSEDSSKKLFTIPGYENVDSYCKVALRKIMAATKAFNALPTGSDFVYYSTFKGFKKIMEDKEQSILPHMASLIKSQKMREKFQAVPFEEKFELVEEINQVIFENTGNCIDEACGQKKSKPELVLAAKPIVINTSWNKKRFTTTTQKCKLLSAKNIPRPQLTFKDKIDNSNSPFIPIIKDKPNSIKPLAITLETDNNKEEFCHPYECEIEKFTVSENILQEVEPIRPRSLDETPLINVKTEEQLRNLCEELKQQKEFAVDLEHHSYRSFQGFTCLIQISTRDTDYIIDALELRSELHLLNDTFTDPKIVKVFHGADMDIIWLQRDFGVYVVNLFDTGQAARVLKLAHLSLSYLLKHYCHFDADKQFQLADWRIRPLPSEMLKYARQDTHYLLYIYDCLKNDLIKAGNETKNLLRSAFERSRLICLKKYEKPLFCEDTYIEMYKKSKKTLNAKQLYCLKELYCWRDKIARENDESLGYVLPNHMMLQIAETLPRYQEGVLACCNPIPPFVSQQLNEIHSIVSNASTLSVEQLTAAECQQKAHNIETDNEIDLEDPTLCLHDILDVDDRKIHSSDSYSPVTILSRPPSLTAMFESPKKNKKELLKKISDILSKQYSPFQRYEMTERLQADQETLKDKNSNEINKTPEAENSTNELHQEVCIDLEDDIIVCDDVEDDVVICNEEDTTTYLNRPSTSTSENICSTPLRKQSKKKKRKAQSDISLNCSSIDKVPPPKKSKSPEVITIHDNFVPFDYSKADLNSFSGKKRSKNVFRSGTDNNFKGPEKHHGRNKKHGRQETFGKNKKQEKKKWPQNK